MDKHLFQTESPDERLRLLRDNSEKTEVVTYMRELTEEERTEALEQSAKQNLAIAELQNQLKGYSGEIKGKIKAHQSDLTHTLGEIRTNHREYTDECFMIADHVEGMMGTYTPDGELISTRPLRPEERQTRIRTLQAAQ